MPNDNAPVPVPEHSQVIVFPPVIPLTGFLLGVLLGRLWPVESSFSNGIRVSMRGAGVVLFGIGAVGFAWMLITMKRAATPIHNTATPTALVQSGPFRWTRNPMYLFGSITYAGFACLLIQPWSLALLPAVLWVTHHGVVLREETYLERRFGGDYREYKNRVRRWL